MKQLLITIILLAHFSYAATSEQLEQYLLVSNAEEELLALEAQFSSMQSNFSKDANDSDSTTYDMQMLSVRFKDYLQKQLSEDEMTEVLENYKKVILLQFVSSSSDVPNYDENETLNYVTTLKANPDEKIRIELVEKISKKLYSKEGIVIMFDGLMQPLIQSGIGGEKMNPERLKGMKEEYLKVMLETSQNETLFASRDFTIDELEALLIIAKTPAIDHETKAVFGAMAYALKEFFLSMASRYDVSKHQSPSTKNGNENHVK